MVGPKILKPDDTCIALGYWCGVHRAFQPTPSVRIGHLIPWVAPGMLRSSCLIDGLDDRGGGLFDLEGRLIGIHLMAGFSDYHTFTGPEIMHLDIRIVQDHWRNLAAKKPLGEKATAGQSKTGVASSDETLPAVPSPDSPELAAVAAKIREATVAMVTFPQDPPFGCSGTIVTPDGYIATCGHHHKARGFDTTVYFADGRPRQPKSSAGMICSTSGWQKSRR